MLKAGWRPRMNSDSSRLAIGVSQRGESWDHTHQMTTTPGPPDSPSPARRWLIASFASGLAAVAIVAAMALYLGRPAAPQYFTAVAQIMLIDRDTSELRGPLFEQVGTTPSISQASRAAVTTLRSRSFVEQVARDLGLLAASERSTGTNFFDTMAGTVAPKPEPQQDAVVDALLASLRVNAREGSSIDVHFTATEPGEAIRGANRVAERFRDSHASPAAPQDEVLTSGLTEELSVLEREEKRLSAIVAAAKDQSIENASEQAALDAHEAARSELATANARLDNARDLVLAGEAHRLLDPSTSTLARYLVDARGSIQRLIGNQKDSDSPRGQQLAADLASIDRQIARQAQQITEKQQQMVEAAKAREAELAKTRGDAKAMKDSSSKSAGALAKVRAAIKTKRAELHALAPTDDAERGGTSAGSVRLTLAQAATANDAEFGRTAVAIATGLVTALVGLAAFGTWTYVGARRSASAPLTQDREFAQMANVETHPRRPDAAGRTGMTRKPGRTGHG